MLEVYHLCKSGHKQLIPTCSNHRCVRIDAIPIEGRYGRSLFPQFRGL